jgi:hypothetical protein
MGEAKDVRTDPVNSSKTLINLYQTILLYRCEAWSLTLRKEYRQLAFENREMIFGSKRDRVTG